MRALLTFLGFLLMLTGCQPTAEPVAQIPADDTSHLSSPQVAFLESAQANVRTVGPGNPTEAGKAWAHLARTMHGFDLRPGAITSYQQALVFLPEDATSHYLLGLLLQEVAQPEKAVPHFQKTSEIEPTYVPNLLALAEFYLRQSNYPAASQYFSQVLEVEAENVVALAGFATLTLEQREFERALHWAQKGLKLAPDVSRLHYLAAMALRNLGQTEASTNAFEKSQQVSGKLPLKDPYFEAVHALANRDQRLVDQALEAAAKNQWESAETLLTQACEWEPKSVVALYQLGRIQHQRGKYQEALQALDRAALLGPTQGLIHHQRAQVLARLGQTQPAGEAFQKAVELDANALVFHIDAGNHARRAKNFESALAIYETSLRHYPKDWRLNMGLVLSLIYLEKHAEAKAHIEGLLKRPLTPPPFFLLLARILSASPQAEVRDGARATELIQDLVKTGISVDLLETAAMAMAEQGDFAKALEWQDGAIELISKSLQRQQMAQLKARRLLYEQKKPCREPFATDDPIFTKPI